jgi:hypothetical protein
MDRRGASGSHCRFGWKLWLWYCRYPKDRVPPRTSSGSRQKVRHANHTPLSVVNLSMNRVAQASSGTTTCPTDPAPAARPGAAPCPVDPAPAARPEAAPGPLRVLRPQLPLPDPGQLRGLRVSCGLSSHYPARGSSGVATCALEAQRSACY